MQRYCRYCGAEMHSANPRYCPTCGKPVLPKDTNPPPSDFYLKVHIPGQVSYEIPLTHTSMTLGRMPSSHIHLTLPYVSVHHGRLDFDGTDWCYVDLESTNGTYINGCKVQRADLRQGDIIRIGDPQGNSIGMTLLLRGVDAVQPNLGIIPIDSSILDMRSDITIGRDPASLLHLPGAMISWKQAVIAVEAQGHVLHDLNSTNGTFVNGKRILTSHFLREGDEIQIGPYILLYNESGVQQFASTGGVRLDGINITCNVGKGKAVKSILKEISLSVYPREFIALVGTSGAGKSTLLKALSGVIRAQNGRVMINGDNLYDQYDLYRTMIGYVPQDDILHRDLKVGDALRYSARLRLPSDTTPSEIEERIDAALGEVEMSAQKEQVINSLSGGQRKRVSIASELLAEPRLFFLDEPTSGLDPGLEKKMMYTLRRLADAGRTVILVTHATANISQCDHVCFLSQGQLTYFGPPGETFGFFGVSGDDFSDIYDKLDDNDALVAQKQADNWVKQYHQSAQYSKYVMVRQESQAFDATGADSTPSQRPRVNLVMQTWILTQRYFDLVLRDKTLLTILMAVMPVTALLIAFVSSENRLIGDNLAEINRQLEAEIAQGLQMASYRVVGESQRLLFIMTLVTVLLGLFASVYEIIKEWSVYERERMVTLRILPYITSKIIVMGSFSFIQCFLFIFVIGLRVDFPADGVFLPAILEIYITICLSTLSAIMMGLFISVIVPNSNTVIYLVFLAVIVQIIFAGVLYELPGPGAKASVITLTRWSVEALGAIVDVESINELTRTRIHLNPISDVITTEVEKPADDWEPVTVVTKTKDIEIPVGPGIVQTVPISMPELIVNDVITEMVTITKTFSFEPDPIDISNKLDFQNNYERSLRHLLTAWCMIFGIGIFFCGATAVVLRRKDV